MLITSFREAISGPGSPNLNTNLDNNVDLNTMTGVTNPQLDLTVQNLEMGVIHPSQVLSYIEARQEAFAVTQEINAAFAQLLSLESALGQDSELTVSNLIDLQADTVQSTQENTKQKKSVIDSDIMLGILMAIPGMFFGGFDLGVGFMMPTITESASETFQDVIQRCMEQKIVGQLGQQFDENLREQLEKKKPAIPRVKSDEIKDVITSTKIEEAPTVSTVPNVYNDAQERADVETAALLSLMNLHVKGKIQFYDIMHKVDADIQAEKVDIIKEKREFLDRLILSREQLSKNALDRQKELKDLTFQDIEFDFGFDPFDVNNKYSLVNSDNLDTRVFKTLLNFIYTFKSIIENSYRHDNAIGLEFNSEGTINANINQYAIDPNHIHPKNLGIMLGQSEATIRNWIHKLEDNKFTFTRDHQINLRKMRKGLYELCSNYDLSSYWQNFIEPLFDNLITIRYIREDRFVMRFLTLLDENIEGEIINEFDVSANLKHGVTYLKKFRESSISIIETYSKYFQLITTVDMITFSENTPDQNDFNFVSLQNFNTFKKLVRDLAYDTMKKPHGTLIEPYQFSELRFNIICDILHSLTKLRYQNPVEVQKSIHNVNRRGFFTYVELNEQAKLWRTTLGDQLRSGVPSYQLCIIRPLLNEAIKQGINEAKKAKKDLDYYLKEERRNAQQMGKILSPCFEKLTIEYLDSKGGLSTRGQSYPNSLKVPDNIILRYDKNRNYDIRNIEDQSILKIPDELQFISVDYTLASKYKFVFEKLEKAYQSPNKFLIIVLLGHKTDTSIMSLRNKLRKKQIETPDKYRNVAILTTQEYKQFLGFGGYFEKEFNILDALSFSVFRAGGRRSLEGLLTYYSEALNYFDSLDNQWFNRYF
ncbi:MAG: hypothetical protein ACFFBT_05360 [Promethearchaeota archaeon]